MKSPPDSNVFGASERVAFVTYQLVQGRRFRTAEAADELGITRRGAYALLDRISRVLPLVQDEEGTWLLIKE